jgi:hypothetical protein
MSLLSTIYDRRISSILSKCNTLTQKIKLHRVYDENIKIKEQLINILNRGEAHIIDFNIFYKLMVI